MIKKKTLDKIISKYSLKQQIYEVAYYGVREVEGYDFGCYYNNFSHKWSLQWCDSENEFHVAPLDRLYLNKEEAKFVHKFFCQKTVEFHPPMWKDVQDSIECLKKSSADVDYVVVQQFLAKDRGLIELDFSKCEGNFQIELVNSEGNTIQAFDLTEEGYENALVWAKDLFLGELNGDL